MKTTRRQFLTATAGLAAGAAVAPSLLSSQPVTEVLTACVPPSLLRRDRLPAEPVTIESIDLLRSGDRLFVRSRSRDGVEGISYTNDNLRPLLGMLQQLVIPFFVGKDARELETLLDGVYRDARNYKFSGMPFWNCVGHVEVSLLDLLGKTASLPAGRLFGDPIRSAIPVYLSSTSRDRSPEQEVELMARRLAETGSRAAKMKVGGRMSCNADARPGRTEAIVPLARKVLGDEVTLYFDSNGSYDVRKGIEVGHLLRDHGVRIYEEPCPWEEYEHNKAVADALEGILLAGGEQDSNPHHFGFMIRNRVVDVVQPDLFYNGGMIRCLRVAAIAQAYGMEMDPHSPKTDPLAAPMLHVASLIPNLGPYQEVSVHPQAESWFAPDIEVRNGHVQVPTGPGMGVEYEPELWARAVAVAS
jgi:D-galactarolactone cycloisomerase